MTALAHPMVARRDAAAATLRRYKGRLHQWGVVDCVRIAAFHLKRLGYQPRLAKGGDYASERGAVRALKRAGFDHPAAALADLGLVEIAPAAALVGDILGLKSAGEWPALAVCLGNGRVLTSTAEHPAYGITTPRMLKLDDPANEVLTAWRADPCAHRLNARFRKPSTRVGSGDPEGSTTAGPA